MGIFKLVAALISICANSNGKHTFPWSILNQFADS